ncbi:MAG: carbonic anhydrase [Limnohabitans sp.]|nr:carbonic anhydrase [Limnohabitans sp.]
MNLQTQLSLPHLALTFVAPLFVAVGCATTSSSDTTTRATTPAAPNGIAKGAALAELKAGNARFVNSTATAHTWQTERVAKTGEFGQTPSVGVLSCADSRVPVEMVFDQGVGELFVVRVAGNSESDTAAGTFEYGVAALGVHTILVLGHTKCGAVDAAVAGKPLPGNMGSFTKVIAPALEGKKFDNLTAAAEANVRWQADQLLKRSEILRAAHEKGDLTMLRGIYEVETGVVRFID